MNIDLQLIQRAITDVEKCVTEKSPYTEGPHDLVLLHNYGTNVFSQIGLGLCGWTLREQGQNWLMTVKVIEGGTPLVAYITSRSPTGCVEQLFYMLESDKVRWHRDQYPWI